jgi:hypothetical protein
VDVFPKLSPDFSSPASKTSALSTRIFLSLSLVLLLSDFLEFLKVRSAGCESVSVDTSLSPPLSSVTPGGDEGGASSHGLRINLNITFPALACEDVHLDAMDVAGDNQLNLDDSWAKHRLGKDGRVLHETAMEEVANEGEKERGGPEPLPADYCGDCYGAGEGAGACCNTCRELLDAYDLKGWSTKSLGATAEQCRREGYSGGDKLTKLGEGCNLSGSMRVNKVAGNFHVAMGNSVVKDGRHIHQFLPADAPNYNTTHEIHELSFGERVPGQASPLDGRRRGAVATTGLYL